MPPGNSPGQTLHIDTDLADEFSFGDDNIWPEHVVWEEGHAELEGKHEDECMHAAVVDDTPADHALQCPATSNGAQDGEEDLHTQVMSSEYDPQQRSHLRPRRGRPHLPSHLKAPVHTFSKHEKRARRKEMEVFTGTEFVSGAREVQCIRKTMSDHGYRERDIALALSIRDNAKFRMDKRKKKSVHVKGAE